MKNNHGLRGYLGLLLCVSLPVLTACGGGGGDEDEMAPPEAAKLIIESAGNTGSFEISDGLGHRTTVAGDGIFPLSTLPIGSTYQITFPVQPTNAYCEASPTSGVISADTTLNVSCSPGLSLTDPDQVYSASQIMVVGSFIPLVDGTIAGTIDDVVPVNILVTGGNLTVQIPVVPDGEHTLKAKVAGRDFSFKFSTLGRVLTDTPRTVIENFLTRATTGLDEAIGRESSSSQISYFREVKGQVNKLRSDIASKSDADLKPLAEAIEFNTVPRYKSDTAAKSAAFPKDGQFSCTNPSVNAFIKSYRSQITGAVVGVALFTYGGPELKAAGLISIGVSLGYLADSVDQLVKNENGCIGQIAGLFDSNASTESKATLRSAKAAQTLTFNHKKAKVIYYKSTYRFIESAASLQKIKSGIDFVIAKSPDSFSNALGLKALSERFKILQNRPIPASLRVRSISDSRMKFSQSYDNSTGAITLTVTLDKDLKIRSDIPFTAGVAEYNNGEVLYSKDVAGLLNKITPPIAGAGSFTVATNISTSFAVDAQYADTVEIFKMPKDGTLTLTDAIGGVVSYAPNKDYQGDDSFEYRAHNDFGYSDPAVVKIKVGGNCRFTDGATQKILNCAEVLDGPYITLEVYTFSPDMPKKGILQFAVAPPGVVKAQNVDPAQDIAMNFATGKYTEGRNDYKIIKGSTKNTYVPMASVYGVSDPANGVISIYTQILKSDEKGFGRYGTYIYCDNSIAKRVLDFIPTDSVGEQTGDKQNLGGVEIDRGGCPTSIDGVAPISLNSATFYKKYELDKP